MNKKNFSTKFRYFYEHAYFAEEVPSVLSAVLEEGGKQFEKVFLKSDSLLARARRLYPSVNVDNEKALLKEAKSLQNFYYH